MSWIVASLLNNRDTIKAEANIDSDEFNDLLMVEKAIQELKEDNKLDNEDLGILSLASSGLLSEFNRNEKYTIHKKFTYLCERIAYYLGGYFTDEGYLDDFAKKHKLSSEQVDILRKYIRSRNKHRIIRKPINVK